MNGQRARTQGAVQDGNPTKVLRSMAIDYGEKERLDEHKVSSAEHHDEILFAMGSEKDNAYVVIYTIPNKRRLCSLGCAQKELNMRTRKRPSSNGVCRGKKSIKI